MHAAALMVVEKSVSTVQEVHVRSVDEVGCASTIVPAAQLVTGVQLGALVVVE